MAASQLIAQPSSGIVSVHEPIKYTYRISGDTNNEFKSAVFIITPRNPYTNVLDSSKQVRIRVQPSLSIPNIATTSGGNASSIHDFSLDISSILRDFMSYDLRACTHDTSNGITRDITQSMPSTNMFIKYAVVIIAEKLDANGALVTADSSFNKSVDGTNNAMAANVALSDEELNSLTLANTLLTGSDANKQNSALDKAFTHSFSNKTGRVKYLTLKPNHRVIGVDESEYISLIADSDGGESIAQIQFTLKNGSVLQDGQGNTLTLNIDHSAQGDGTYSGATLFAWGGDETDNLYASGNITRGVFQFGVGTRNIKEAFIGWTSRTNDGTPPIGDWSNIASYEVYTRSTGGSIAAIGQKLVYHINHDSEKDKFFDKSVRFHWQSRLGGIDSYTFDGMSTEGISVKSKMYEQSIYPQFNAQLGASAGNSNFFAGLENQNTSDSYGALQSRIGGLTSDEYRSATKSTVKAFREGQAASKPYPKEQKGMMEDLLSSPNVWIERGWRGKEVFREDFSSTPTTDDWILVDGDFTTDGGVSAADGHTTGTNTYFKGNNSGDDEVWATSKKLVKYNPDKIYEVEVRVKRELGSGNTYVGLTGYKADKTTAVSIAGADATSNAHFITLSGYVQTADDEWEVHRGYITGLRESEGFTFPRNSANFASKAHEDVKFFSPLFAMNYNDAAGKSFIDYLVVREYESDLPNTQGWYSTLNRNYYVPVNIKDSKTNTSDSENQSTMTINYVESKNKKTIQ